MRDIFVLASGAEPGELTSRPVKPGPATVSLSNLCYGYERGPPTVRAVNASIKAGGLTVLAGANGSGKSTLARLMAGLLDPTDGRVCVDGICLAEIAAEERHRHVLYVPQHVGLFSRTLRHNGLYPPTRLDSSRLISLLLAFRFHGDGRAPDLDLRIGEAGQGLSGGQAQKLELARLAGVDTPVIILDETTSALDPASELAVVDVLRRERAGTTLVLITHRHAIAEKADQILFMADGMLRFSGTHNALMGEREYREFWIRAPAKPHEDG